MKPGAVVTPQGVQFAVWAPAVRMVKACIETSGGQRREVALQRGEGGWHAGLDTAGRVGDIYGFCLDGGPVRPDPASRGQVEGVHGRSLVVDAASFVWTDQSWRRPAFRNLVIYELHVGAFTEAGTFLAAIEKLPLLREMGVNAIEILPIADFPGRWNWGYDGVLIYAPAQAYGSPEDFRSLVNAAHAAGLAVILDVVFNHFGPDGNYLRAYSPSYFSTHHATPWGDGFNFDGEGREVVRQFFTDNPIYWMEDFHVDGFRFDATHEIKDDSTPHILAEMVSLVHARGGYAIAEDSRNEGLLIERSGGMGFDAVWADDFHHAARVSQTKESQAYYQDFSGTLEEVIECMRHGWLYCGQMSKFLGKTRGTRPRDVLPSAFIHCLSNHDQTGNQALGKRISSLVSPGAYRMLSMLLCFTPCTPMLFMGQEWAASSPFLYFCDHQPDLGKAITEGRRREFSGFSEFSELTIPDPQAETTFLHSKLNWAERTKDACRKVVDLYRCCLAWRARHSAFRPISWRSWEITLHADRVGLILFRESGRQFLLCFALSKAGIVPPWEGENWELVLSSQETRFGGAGLSAWRGNGQPLDFRHTEAFLLERPER